jgi:hypothetical protein
MARVLELAAQEFFRLPAAVAPPGLEAGTISALVNENVRIARRGRALMLDVCDQCGSGVNKRLLRCSDGTAVVHRECTNGHKQHRTSGASEQKATDPRHASGFFVIVEGCDCN